MNILYVASGFKPAWNLGGVVRVAYDLCRAMSQRGHDVTVYTTDKLDHGRRVGRSFDDSEGFDVHYFRNLSNTLALGHYSCAPGMLHRLKETAGDFDVVHIHEYRTVHGLFAAYRAKKAGVPYLIQAHGAVAPAVQDRRIKRLFDGICGYRILAGASKLIALTASEAAHYRAMGADAGRIAIVSNGIDPAEYRDLPERGTFRREHGIGPDDGMALYLGRLHRTKGVDLLVRAFAGVVREEPRAKLVIAGPDNGYGSTVQEEIRAQRLEDAVVLTGFITQVEKMAALADADVFVTPRFSGLPMTFLEACACGTPIVTTVHGDAVPWLQDVGFVVGYDATQLRNAILGVLGDAEMRWRLGEAGRRLVREELNWKTIARRFEELYQSLPAPAGRVRVRTGERVLREGGMLL